MNNDLNDHIICIHDEYYLSIEFLLNHGISRQTIDNGTSRNRKELSRRWKHIKDNTDNRRNFIEYNSIPNKSREKLPKLSEIEFIYKNNLEKQSQIDIDKELRIVYFGLENAIKTKWTKFAPIYNEHFGANYDLVKMYAQTHVALIELLEYKRNYKVKDLFPIYQKFEGLKFKTNNESSFYRKLNQASVSNIENILIHNLFGKDSNNQKLTKQHKAFIKNEYKKPLIQSCRIIHQKLIRYCVSNGLAEVSYETVKNYLNNLEIQNESDPFRYGIKEAKKKSIPWLDREKPPYPGDLWEGDGVKIQIPYIDQNGDVKSLYAFIILDSHSNKIVGYSIDVSENSSMILEAFKQACKNTGYLPCEILHDNFSAFNHSDFIEFQEKCELKKVTFRRAKVNNPQDKSHVERLFYTYQTTILKKSISYIGEGIISKNKEARRAQEFLNSSLYKNSLKRRPEFDQFFDKIINDFNSHSIEKKPSPNTVYDYTSPENIYKLDDYEQAYLFFKKTKITLNRSTILLGSEKRVYQFKDGLDIKELTDLRLKLNGNRFLVAYDPDDTEKIYLFEENTKQYKVTMYLAKPVPIVSKYHTKEHKAKILNHAKVNKEYLNELARRTKEDMDILYDDTDNETIELMLNKYTKKEHNKAREKLELQDIDTKITKKVKDKLKKENIDLGSYYEEGSLRVISKN